MTTLALALALFAAPQTTSAPPPPASHQVTLLGDAARALEHARELDLELWGPTSDGLGVQAIANDAALAELARRGVPHRVDVVDLQAFYAARLAPDPAALLTAPPELGAWLVPPFGQGSMGGYYTYAEIQSVMAQIEAAHPSIVSAPVVLGQSVEGRDVRAWRVTDAPGASEGEPEVRMDALHHAREAMSVHALIWYLLFLVEGYGTDTLADYLVDERDTWFVPVVNPDGYLYNESIAPGGGGMWRKNRRDNGNGSFGVDLNRNYTYQWGYDDEGSSGFTASETYRGPSAASEPEVAAMEAFLAAHSFATALTIHTHGAWWLYPIGYDYLVSPDDAAFDEISDLATEVNGYYAGRSSEVLYLANGTTKDHDYGVHGTFAWTPELNTQADGHWPPTERILPLARENLLALQRSALAAGAFVHATDVALTDEGDGDGWFEAGETVAVRVSLRNSGRAATGTAVIARLTTTSPHAALVDAEHDFGAIASFAGADNAAQPLRLAIAPGAAAGTQLDETWLELEYEGHVVERIDLDVLTIVGEAVAFVRDDLETDLGWTVGAPGDGASTGVWERGDPIGTTWNGEPVSPEDDTTPAGTQCYTTGNGGGSGGTDDVDGGATTLTTARFDLSAVTTPRIELSVWYVDTGDRRDDVLTIDVSNDDGQSWTPLDVVPRTTDGWERESWVVSEHVTPTAEMRLRLRTSDDPNNSLVDAAVDDLEVLVYDESPRFNLFGSAELGTALTLNVTGEPSDFYLHLWSTGTADLPVEGVVGDLLLDPLQLYALVSGLVSADGLARRVVQLPSDNSLAGLTLYFQPLVVGPSTTWFANRDELTLF